MSRFFSILLLFLIFINGIVASEDKCSVKNGVIDLSGYDFSTNGNVKLHGEWKFYNRRFIDYRQAIKDSGFCYLKVPKSWDKQECCGEILKSDGFGTYYLKIILGSENRNSIFTFLTKNVSLASRIFVNGKLVGYNGIVADRREKYIPELGINLVSFIPTCDTLNVIIHAANFNIIKSGLCYSFEMGLSEQIVKESEKNVALDTFIMGSIILMMLYYFMLFFFRRKEKAFLYFALTCFAFVFYALCLSKAYSFVFEGLGFEADYKMKRLALYLSIPTMTLYIYQIFKSDFSKLVLKILLYFFAAFFIANIFFSSRINTHFITYFRYVGIVAILYFFFVIIKAVRNKRMGAWLFIAGVVIIFIAVLNDFLHNVEVIRTMDVMPIGMFMFLLTQAYFLSMQYNRAFLKSEQLTDELTYINKNLEKIVEERTHEIAQQKHVIEEKNEELNQLLEEVTAQRDEIESQRDMVTHQKEHIEEIHKEISQSIEYAKRIQSSILSDPAILSKHLSDYFVLFRPKDVVSGDFYWWSEVEGCLMITAADCTGHGVPGGFMSMLGVSFLREIVVKEYITHPGIVLKRLRKEIINVMKQKGLVGEQKDGMDMVLVNINLETKMMLFAGANNPIYLVRDGELIEYKGDKMPIAIYERMEKFNTAEIQLKQGDQIYMFSDGFADQFGGPDNKKFKYKTFKDTLLANSRLPMDEQRTLLMKTFDEWRGNYEQVDDICVLGIKI